MNRKKIEKMSDSEKLTLHLWYSCLMWAKVREHTGLLGDFDMDCPHPELWRQRHLKLSRSERQILKRLVKLCDTMSAELRKEADRQFRESFRRPEPKEAGNGGCE